jgi:hypothetical protein
MALKKPGNRLHHWLKISMKRNGIMQNNNKKNMAMMETISQAGS